MTTIFWSKNRIYADSSILKGEEGFQSLTKIKKFPQPVPFVSYKFDVDDVVHGWFCTGAIEPAKELATAISQFGCVDIHFACYDMADGLKMLNFENHFELILIGEKFNYSIIPGDKERPAVTKYDHKDGFVVGSGSPHLRRILANKKQGRTDPIRLMYSIYCMDKTSGGLIDVWELKHHREGGATFQRIGICQGLEGRNPAELVADLSKPYPFDWKLNQASGKLVPMPSKKTPKHIKAPRSVKRYLHG